MRTSRSASCTCTTSCARAWRRHRHCEPTGRANARPMTGSAKQSRAAERGVTGLLRRFAPKKKQTDKLLILFNVMDEPPPSVLFHPRGSAKGRCGTRNDGNRHCQSALRARATDRYAFLVGRCVARRDGECTDRLAMPCPRLPDGQITEFPVQPSAQKYSAN